MIIQGDNLVVGGNTVDATKLDNHDLISVTSDGRVGVNGAPDAAEVFTLNPGRYATRHTSWPSYLWQKTDGTTLGEIYAGVGGGDVNIVSYGRGTANGFNIQTGVNGSVANRFRIDQNGYMTVPYQPAFSAYHPAPTGQSNVVIYGSTRSNVGNCYSTSTGGFTAPVAGHYHFTYNALMQLVTGTPDYCRLYFDINGAHNATFGDTLAGGSGSTAFAGWNYISVTNSITIYLNANDVVKVWNDGPAATYGTGFGTFSGFLIG